MTEILIIRPQSIQLGDTICSLPMFKAIKKRYPDSFITLAGCPTNYNVDLKKLNPYLDDVIIYRKDSLKVQFDFLRELRKKHYDLVVVPSTIRISSTSYIIALLSKGKIKAGIKRFDEEKNPLSFVLDIKAEVDWKKEKTNQVYRFLDCVRGAGCNLSEDEIKSMRIQLSEEETDFGNNFITEYFPDRNKKIFGFHAGGGEKENLWSTGNYFDLISRTYEKYKPYILLTSGILDEEITNELGMMLKNAGINYATAKNLDAYKLASILKHTDLYVSNDTGVMHLAAYAGTKTLTVFRKDKPDEWLPLFNESKYVESRTYKIEDIKTEEVFEKVKEFYP